MSKPVKWHMSHEMYAGVLDTMARRGYGSEADMAAEVRKQYGLSPNVCYEIVVETEQERCKRSLREFFGRDPLATERRQTATTQPVQEGRNE